MFGRFFGIKSQHSDDTKNNKAIIDLRKKRTTLFNAIKNNEFLINGHNTQINARNVMKSKYTSEELKKYNTNINELKETVKELEYNNTLLNNEMEDVDNKINQIENKGGKRSKRKSGKRKSSKKRKVSRKRRSDKKRKTRR